MDVSKKEDTLCSKYGIDGFFSLDPSIHFFRGYFSDMDIYISTLAFYDDVLTAEQVKNLGTDCFGFLPPFEVSFSPKLQSVFNVVALIPLFVFCLVVGFLAFWLFRFTSQVDRINSFQSRTPGLGEDASFTSENGFWDRIRRVSLSIMTPIPTYLENEDKLRFWMLRFDNEEAESSFCKSHFEENSLSAMKQGLLVILIFALTGGVLFYGLMMTAWNLNVVSATILWYISLCFLSFLCLMVGMRESNRYFQLYLFLLYGGLTTVLLCTFSFFSAVNPYLIWNSYMQVVISTMVICAPFFKMRLVASNCFSIYTALLFLLLQYLYIQERFSFRIFMVDLIVWAIVLFCASITHRNFEILIRRQFLNRRKLKFRIKSLNDLVANLREEMKQMETSNEDRSTSRSRSTFTNIDLESPLQKCIRTLMTVGFNLKGQSKEELDKVIAILQQGVKNGASSLMSVNLGDRLDKENVQMDEDTRAWLAAEIDPTLPSNSSSQSFVLTEHVQSTRSSMTSSRQTRHRHSVSSILLPSFRSVKPMDQFDLSSLQENTLEEESQRESTNLSCKSPDEREKRSSKDASVSQDISEEEQTSSMKDLLETPCATPKRPRSADARASRMSPLKVIASNAKIAPKDEKETEAENVENEQTILEKINAGQHLAVIKQPSPRNNKNAKKGTKGGKSVMTVRATQEASLQLARLSGSL